MAAKRTKSGKLESKAISNGDAEMIGTAEAGRILDLDPSSLRRWLAEGRLKGVKVGRNWRFDRRTVEEMASAAFSAVTEFEGQKEAIPTAPFIKSLWGQIEKRLGKQTVEQAKQAAGMFQTAMPKDKSNGDSFLCGILGYASEAGASDIHIEPLGKETRIRCRMDGVLHEAFSFPAKAAPALIAEMKGYAEGMNVSESRVPQSGWVRLELPGRTARLACNVSPSISGEVLVIRVLDPKGVVLGIDHLDFEPEQVQILKRLIHQPNGLILLTGRTGSGKSTTIYSLLSEINHPSRKIVTIEDPVEYILTGIQQIPLNPNVGLTFDRLLRNCFRQNAEVIMAGEIRDRDTANLMCQGAITGHLTISSLHASDAPAAYERLVTITSLPPSILEDVILGIIAQKLVRRLCSHCKEGYKPSAKELKGLPISGAKKLYRAKGCPKCFETGFRGMLPLAEIIVPDDGIRAALAQGGEAEVRKAAQESQYMTMRDSGLAKVARGETTIEEVINACGSKDGAAQ